MNEKKKKKLKILLAVAILGILLVAGGTTYAFFQYSKPGNKVNTLQTGTLTFYYGERGNSITLENALPTHGSFMCRNMNCFEFDIMAETKGAPIYYEIYATKTEESSLPGYIVETGLKVGEQPPDLELLVEPYSELPFSRVPEYILGENRLTGSRTLYQGMIPESDTVYFKNFMFTMWISEDAGITNGNGEWIYNNMSFTVKINVYASNEPIPVPDTPTSTMESAWENGYSLSSPFERFGIIDSIKFLNYIPSDRHTSGEIYDLTKDYPDEWQYNSSSGLSPTFSNGVKAWIEEDYSSLERTLVVAASDWIAVDSLSGLFKNLPVEHISLENLYQLKEDEEGYRNMSSMFEGCDNLKGIDWGHIYTSDVTNMANMFSGCSSLTGLGLKHFDTSNVTDMSGMFSGCSSLTDVYFKNFNTSNVTDMSNMFRECSSLGELDLNRFNTSNVTNMGYMFANCKKLSGLWLLNANFSKVEQSEGMFEGAFPTDYDYVKMTVKDQSAKDFILSKLSPDQNVHFY